MTELAWPISENEVATTGAVPAAVAAAMLEQAGEFHMLTDAHGDLIWVDDPVRSVLGHEPRDLVNAGWWSLAHPDDLERCRGIVAELLTEPGGRRRMQYRARHVDGAWRWIECVATNLIEAESVVGIVLTVRDVSSRVAAKRRLSQSERRLRSIVSSAGDVIAILDDQGVIEYVTPTIATVAKRSAVMMQDNWLSYVHPDDLETISDLFAAALEDPGTTLGPVDARLLSGDDAWVTFEVLFTDYRSDPIVRGIVLNARDVTARRRIEQEKQANQTIFNTLVEMAPIGIFLADSNCEWSYANARIAADFGLAVGVLLGMGWTELFSPEDVTRLRRELSAWTGEAPLVTCLRTRTSPSPRELRMTVSRPPAANPSLGIVGTLEDITNRRAVDDMLVEGAALGSVAGVVSSAAHDLHNLLASIGMQLGLLDRDSGATVRVQAAEEAIDRACDITEDLMTISRPSRGLVAPLEIGPLVADLADMLRVLVEHQADLTFDDRSAGWMAAVDRSGLERVVTNLVVNARDAIDTRSTIRIEVDVVEVGEADVVDGGRAGPHVAISVIDDGCGIPAACLDRVFEPYFTTKEDGNGIGLAASRRTVRTWGGDLWFTSTEGTGTTMVVVLPAS